MVQQGFFPQWVADVPAFMKVMGWDEDAQPMKNRVGVYFNNSGLHKGQYKFDQWIRLGRESDVASVCPRSIRVGTPMVFAKDLVAH